MSVPQQAGESSAGTVSETETEELNEFLHLKKANQAQR